MLLERDEVEESHQLLAFAAQHGPPVTLLWLGSALLKRGDIDRAREVFGRAAASEDPDVAAAGSQMLSEHRQAEPVTSENATSGGRWNRWRGSKPKSQCRDGQ